MNSKMIPVAVINPDAPPESLEAKQPDVDNGAEIYGKDGYFSAEQMAQEWDKVWTQSWLIAGVSADLQELGDYFLFRLRSESIIVTKTEDGVKAFYNVCPHRGARLLTEERGNKKVFVCPFHSWSFRNNGELRTITDEETFQDAVICHRPGLTPVACEEHAGIIFISMADDPPALKDAIGLPEGYLENYQIDQMRVVRHVRSEWGSNWKVGVEAFYESYHLHAVHPETRGVMGDLNVQYDCYPNGASRMIVPLGQPSPVRPTRPRLTRACSTCCKRQALTPQVSKAPPLMCARPSSRPSVPALTGWAWVTSASPTASCLIAGPPVSFPTCRLAATLKPYF